MLSAAIYPAARPGKRRRSAGAVSVRPRGARGILKEAPVKHQQVGKYLYLLLSNKYKLIQIDLSNPKKTRFINRDYTSIKRTGINKKYFRLREFGINNKKYREPDSGYINDIINLASSDNMLWIFTSTRNKNNSIWIDKFDGKEFKSGFWLNIPKSYDVYKFYKQPFLISDEYIYLKISDSDDNFTIEKYKLLLKK